MNIVSCVVTSPNTFAAKTVGELIRPATRAVNCTVPVVVGRVGWYDERPRLSVGTVAVPSVSTPPRTITQPTDTPAMGLTNASSMRTSTGAGRSWPAVPFWPPPLAKPMIVAGPATTLKLALKMSGSPTALNRIT